MAGQLELFHELTVDVESRPTILRSINWAVELHDRPSYWIVPMQSVLPSYLACLLMNNGLRTVNLWYLAFKYQVDTISC